MNNIIRIDYTNDLHLKCIWKLSKNNNFYKEDMRGILYGDPSLEIEKFEKNNNIKLTDDKKIILYNATQQKMNDNLKEYNGRKEYYGLFICNNKKPIGYILYYLRKNNIEVDITFILIDKKYQNQGYGTILINKVKEILSDIKPIIYLKIDDNNLEKYYNKLKFYTLDKVFSLIPNIKSNTLHEKHNKMLYIMTENKRNPTKEKKLAYVY